MLRLSSWLVALGPMVLCLFSVSCRSNSPRSDKYLREYSPALVFEDDLLRVAVRRIDQKRDKVYLRLSLTNKAKREMTLSYGEFFLVHEEAEYPGALKVPFAKSTRSFKMHPGMEKVSGRPILFVGIPDRIRSAAFVIRNIRLYGVDESAEFSFTVPFR